MRVLLFSNLFPTRAEPTRGLFTWQLARELASLCELTVAVPLPWFPGGGVARRLWPKHAQQFGNIGTEWNREGVDAHYLRYPLVPRLSESRQAQLMEFGVGHSIRRLYAERRWDVINAHWLYPDGVAAVHLATRLRTPVVLTALGCDVNEFLDDRRKSAQIMASLRKAAAVTAVSAALGDALVARGVPRSKLTVIPNGVDALRFHPRDRAECRTSLSLPQGDLLVACVSRLSPEKGIDTLIDAAPRLFERVPAARIALIGDGPERMYLESKVARSGLQQRVRFVGNVGHETVALWLGAANAVCIPSLSEGHPNAAMEALASGRPLVASRVGALPSMILPGVGQLVEPANATDLADALTRVLAMPWDSSAISATVHGSSWAAAARHYLAVMESVPANS